MGILSPSILAADFWKLGQQISELEAAGVQWLHIDVMDGLFVPSISFGMPVITSIRKQTKMFFDVHLMIQEPERYLEEFAKSGADLINFHIEATEQPEECIRKIKELGKKVGITIKPATPIQAVEPFLQDVDMILVMTVEPGFGGQKIMMDCVDKVKALREMADQKGLTDLHIEVDGGITAENIGLATAAGADVIVAGSATFKGVIAESVEKLMQGM